MSNSNTQNGMYRPKETVQHYPMPQSATPSFWPAYGMTPDHSLRRGLETNATVYSTGLQNGYQPQAWQQLPQGYTVSYPGYSHRGLPQQFYSQSYGMPPYGMPQQGMSGRPHAGMNGQFGRPMGRPRPKLDPDQIKKFLTTGIDRLNGFMNGVDRMSQTVQQMSPLLSMIKGLGVLGGSSAGASVGSNVDLNEAADTNVTPIKKASSRTKRSRKRK